MKRILEANAFRHVWMVDVSYLGNITQLNGVHTALKSMPHGVDSFYYRNHIIDIASFVNTDFYNEIPNAIEFEFDSDLIHLYKEGDIIYEDEKAIRFNTMWGYKFKLTWLDKIKPKQIDNLVFYKLNLSVRLIWYTNYYIYRGTAMCDSNILLPAYQNI